MTATVEVWTTIGLLDHIQNVDKRMEEKAFAFILGAGASQTAQIPTSKMLVHQWLQELQRRLDPDYTRNSLAQWATADNLAIPGFEYDRAVAFYAQVFERRFRDDPNEGYTYLNEMSEGKTPNIGYLILAQLLTKTRHRIVVTTNQDDLISQAMSIYAHTPPIYASPTDLTKLTRPGLRRPVLAKIHPAPFLSSDEQTLNNNHWSQPLYRLFELYTPIVIGFDEDEGGTIELLKQMEPCDSNGGIFWCYQQDKGRPNGRVEEIVNRRRGKFVPISGFDSFMQQLSKPFCLPNVADEIEQQGIEAARRYRHQADNNSSGTITPPPLQERSQSKAEPNHSHTPGDKSPGDIPKRGTTAQVVLKIVDQVEPPKHTPTEKTPDVRQATVPDWDSWLEKIEAATDLDAKETLYREVIASHPDNATAYGNFAYFMEVARKEYEKAESLYRSALKLDDHHVANIGHFANFMAFARKRYDSAERLYQRAIEIAPDTGLNYINYAGYLIVINNLPKALKYTKQAWALSSQCERDVAALQAAYYRTLIALATRTDASPALARLKALLADDAPRLRAEQWNHTPVTSAMKYKLIPEKHAMIELIADVIKGVGGTDKLDDFPDWKNVETIALSEPWEA